MLAKEVHIWIPSIPDAPVAWAIAIVIVLAVAARFCLFDT